MLIVPASACTRTVVVERPPKTVPTTTPKALPVIPDPCCSNETPSAGWPAEVPENLTVAEAEAKLQAEGLGYQVEPVIDPNEVPVNELPECEDGRVMGFIPNPGSRVAPGTIVSIGTCALG